MCFRPWSGRVGRQLAARGEKKNGGTCPHSVTYSLGFCPVSYKFCLLFRTIVMNLTNLLLLYAKRNVPDAVWHYFLTVHLCNLWVWLDNDLNLLITSDGWLIDITPELPILYSHIVYFRKDNCFLHPNCFSLMALISFPIVYTYSLGFSLYLQLRFILSDVFN